MINENDVVNGSKSLETIENSDVNIDHTDNIQPTPQSEKLFTQEEANKMAKGARIKAKREAEEEYRRQQALSTQNVEINDLIDKKVNEKLDLLIKAAEQEEANKFAKKIVNDLTTKIDAGKSKYPDFDDSVKDLNLPKIFSEAPQVIQATSEVDNTADVLYELSKAPEKIVELLELNKLNPALASRKIKMLSENIKSSYSERDRKANPPLSQIKHSSTGLNSGKKDSDRTVKDFQEALLKNYR